jgi:NADP-dependent 3-hydroxy acid dehydrogenase YdfG
MSTQGSTSNLTSKFSRSSLKKATGHGSASRVHSREEELARATNKRFNNSESWRKISRNYRAFPTASAARTNRFSNPNTQILCALSSLTEDQAFQTGSSDIPLLTRAASYAGNSLPNARENPVIRRPYSRQPVRQYDGSSHSDDNASGSAKLVQTATSSTASSSFAEEQDDFHECHTGQSISSPLRQSSSAGPSLRSAAGRVPKLSATRKFGQAPVPPPLAGLSSNGSTKRSMEQRNGSNNNRYGGTKRDRTRFGSSGVIGSLRSFVSFFFKFFKLLHHLVMLPETIKQYFTKPRWSAKGKCILITGASSGIGAEIARQYAAQGARVALVARTSEDLDRVAEECRELGSSKALYYAADLANPVSIKLAMKQAMKDFGHFDVVILNAGRSQGCYFEEIKDPSQIESMIKLNVNGAITCLHYVLPQVPKHKASRIVFISNTAGIVAAPYQSVYSATKHALSGFANSLRIELKTTYGHESPKICLVSFPEVSGTRYNTSRMDMGAKLPPAKWYSWAGMPLAQAVHTLLPAVAAGKREFGSPTKFNLWRSIYAIFPDWVDFWMVKYIQKTHYRPLEEKNKQASSNHNLQYQEATPHNKSWAC